MITGDRLCQQDYRYQKFVFLHLVMNAVQVFEGVTLVVGPALVGPLDNTNVIHAPSTSKQAAWQSNFTHGNSDQAFRIAVEPMVTKATPLLPEIRNHVEISSGSRGDGDLGDVRSSLIHVANNSAEVTTHAVKIMMRQDHLRVFGLVVKCSQKANSTSM